MNSNQLEVFKTVADKRSFSEAARVLHISQPAISAHIQSLEAYLNTKLFYRTTKKVDLTEAGRVLYKYARQIDAIFERAQKEIAEVTGQVRGNLLLGASLTIGEYILPAVAGGFAGEYPAVHINMVVINSERIIEMVASGELDLGFIEAPLTHEKLRITPFMKDELIVVAPAHFSINSLGVDEIKSFPFVVREPGSGTRMVMKEALENLGVKYEELNVIMELGSTEAVKSAVEAGAGITVISASAVSKELKLGSLKKINIKGARIPREFYIVESKGRTLFPSSRAFKEFLIARVGKVK